MKMKSLIIVGLMFLTLLSFQRVFSQTTEFTYQGSLTNGGAAANGSFDFEFALFDTLAGGSQIGPTIALSNVPVTNGIFSVNLNFGNQFSAGGNRFLEVRVRPAGQPGITVLSPRQLINSAPYAVKSLNAETAVSATLFSGLTTTDFIQNRTSQQSSSNFNISGNGTIGGNLSVNGTLTANLPAGDSDYIQNRTTQQAATNFNISGTGTAATLQADSFRLGNLTVLRGQPGFRNLFMGLSAGSVLLTGQFNAGFGDFTGNSLTDGSFNALFGAQAGLNLTTGSANSFIGSESGENTTTGSANTFLGELSGLANTTGSFNTTVGERANVGANNLTNATAIGARAFVSQNNSLILGSIEGINNAAGNTNVGIGTTAPTNRLQIAVNGGNIVFGDAGCPNGSTAIGFSSPMAGCVNYSLRGDGTNVFINRPAGGDVLFRENNGSTQVRINSGGTLAVNVLGASGSTALCRNGSNEISGCSSSIRYKENITPFTPGLDLIRRLRPVSFRWKTGGMSDFGLVAEEVREIEPLLTTTDDKGEIEGVKYDRLGVVVVNAVNEQQTQIEAQQKQIDEQQELIKKQQAEIEVLKTKSAEFEALKKYICSQNPNIALCRPKN